MEIQATASNVLCLQECFLNLLRDIVMQKGDNYTYLPLPPRLPLPLLPLARNPCRDSLSFETSTHMLKLMLPTGLLNSSSNEATGSCDSPPGLT